MIKPVCHAQHLGLAPYQETWELQKTLAAQIAGNTHPPALLLLEHPHTYTFGRRGDAANLLWGEAEQARRGISVHWVDRGGDVTYHGPGQLVGYPLLPLAPGGLHATVNGKSRLPRADYVGYVRKLEKMIIKTLAEFGIVSGQVEGLTGVWVQPNVASRCVHCPPAARKHPSKIAAIGVKVDAKGISRHGFALNVNPDMEYWDGIIGCGLKEHPVISMADLLRDAPRMEQVRDALIKTFGEVFGYEMVFVKE